MIWEAKLSPRLAKVGPGRGAFWGPKVAELTFNLGWLWIVWGWCIVAKCFHDASLSTSESDLPYMSVLTLMVEIQHLGLLPFWLKWLNQNLTPCPPSLLGELGSDRELNRSFQVSTCRSAGDYDLNEDPSFPPTFLCDCQWLAEGARMWEQRR